MKNNDIWKYCTKAQWLDFLLSLNLLSVRAKDSSMKTNTFPPYSSKKTLACLYSLSKQPDRHYRCAYLPKKGGGFRQLFIPDSFLKNVQSNILQKILYAFPISPHAMAYAKGRNSKANAQAHLNQKTVLKLDIESFFDSISFKMILRYGFPAHIFPKPLATLLASLCSYHGALPQGAPSSPALSNLLMHPFDEQISSYCAKNAIHYTRYCDDLSFSGDFDSPALQKFVQERLNEQGFRLNRKKRALLSQDKRQQITGLVVNQKLQVPKQYRKALRQELYYCEKFGFASQILHHKRSAFLPLSSENELRYLASLLGRVNFVLHINPSDTYFKEAKKKLQKIKLNKH